MAALVLLAAPRAVYAQLVGTSLLEVQLGNLPFAVPENRTDFYERLDLEHLSPNARIGLRFESNHNSEDAYVYDEITQRYAEWWDDTLRIRAGHFYTILGRGLVHRSFELPGVVFDQPGLRSRYAPSRDVDGLLAEGSWGPLTGRALWGTPNSGQFSPGTEEIGFERYAGQIAGGEMSASILRHARVGATYLRSTATGATQQESGSGFVDFDPAALLGLDRLFLPVYVEYAQRDRTFSDWWSIHTGDDQPHALYASANLIWRNLALSAEWKDYAQFRTGTNDPPSLIREHSYYLLNRGTHVLNATQEQGFQLEGVYTRPEWGSVTANLSRSDGEQVRPVRFEEKYLELYLAPGDAWDATLFYDTGRDEFVAVSDREVFGIAGTVRLTEQVSIEADLERQHATRGGQGFTDSYLSLSASIANRGTIGLIWEHTDDPQEEDPETAAEPPVEARDFVGGVLSARLSDRHDVTVFYGERRGGPACTAGTCYEVLPLKGVEVRLTSRF